MRNVDRIFENIERNNVGFYGVGTYDVNITLYKRKNSRFGYVIRFGLVNRASKEFCDAKYIQVSSVVRSPSRIYFKKHDEKTYRDCYKISCNHSKSGKSGLYFVMSPNRKNEKIFRTRWAGKIFNLEHDDECGLFYIDLYNEKRTGEL